MAIVFDEVFLSEDYTAVAQGGPLFSTRIIRNPTTGMEQRNIDRYDSQWKGLIDTTKLTTDQIDDLHIFFQARYGKARGFRFQPPYSYSVELEVFAGPGGTQIPNGTLKIFKLYVSYVSGGVSNAKRIVKPVVGTLYNMDGTTRSVSDFKIYFNSGAGDVLQASGYTIDNTTGIITFTTAPPTGTYIKWSGRFDLPVNFETDHFNPTVQPPRLSQASGLGLLEILPSTLSIAY